MAKKSSKTTKTPGKQQQKEKRRLVPLRYKFGAGCVGVIVVAAHMVLGGPFLLWPVLAMVAGLIYLCRGGFRWTARFGRGHRQRREHGMATWWEHHRHMSAGAVRRAAEHTHPHLHRTERRAAGLDDLGVIVGKRWGRVVAATVEEFFLIISPPRSIKTRWMASILHRWPGPAIVASSRLDIMRHTIAARLRRGSVWLLNLDKLGKIASTVRWDLLEGCIDPSGAITRAGQLADAGPKTGDMKTSGFWDSQGFALLRTMLHAAALAGKDAVQAWHWCANPRDPEILRALERAGAPAPHWADWLRGFLRMGDETIAVAAQQAGSCLEFLADPAMRHAACPGPDDDQIRLADFVRSKDTIFLIGADKPRSPFAPFFACFIAAAIAVAKDQAASMPGERLIRKLLAILDEAPIIAPIPVDRLSAETGGWGVTLIVSTQSAAQLEKTWGAEGGEIVWDNAYKVIGPGFDNPKAAKRIAEMCGTNGRHSDPDDPDARAEWIVPPNRLRMLRKSKAQALILARSVRPAVIRLERVHKLRGYEPWEMARCRDLFGTVIDPTEPDEPDLPLDIDDIAEMAPAA